jgi:hypothetical protein
MPFGSKAGKCETRLAGAKYGNVSLMARNDGPPESHSGLAEAAFASTLAGFADGGFNEEPLSSPHGLRNGAAITGATEASATSGPVALATSQAQPAEIEPSNLVGTRKRRSRQLPPSAEPVPDRDEVRSPAASAGSEVRVNDAVAWHIDKSALTLGEARRYRD